jgi:hypothetical protein
LKSVSCRQRATRQQRQRQQTLGPTRALDAAKPKDHTHQELR